MVFEPPVRIENRTQLVYLLSQAAELEHGISCCYLFAGFSMKAKIEEGVTEAQLEAIHRWKATVMEVAVQEMLHLALVNNLLTAIGGSPHIRRPNLPTSPAMFPKSFELDLRPFNEETLGNFIFLERPETSSAHPPGNPEPAAFKPRSLRARDIFFDQPEYETVGHLYRGIEDGFRYLAEKYGEDRLFVGAVESQAAEYPRLPGLIAVSNVETAVEAIERIVEQGEGARGENPEGHYARFVAIGKEYAEIRSRAPSFEPGRPVVVNPYTHVPADLHDPAKLSIIDHPMAVAACNLFDGAYELLIQMLGRFFSRARETPEELKLLTDISTGLMSRILAPLGELITTLPAGPSFPGKCAGPSFYVPRNVHTPPHRQAAWMAWEERLRELSAYCAILELRGDPPAGLARIGQTLGRFGKRIVDAGLAGQRQAG